jgi:hypothetical protein
MRHCVRAECRLERIHKGRCMRHPWQSTMARGGYR